MPDGADIPKAIDDQVQAVWQDSLIYVITGWSNTTNVVDVQASNNDQASEALNNISRVFEDDTILLTGVATVMDKKLEILKNQQITYKFNTSLKDSDINIGDEITLVSEEIRNGSVDLLVIGYTKSLSSISITAMEIYL